MRVHTRENIYKCLTITVGSAAALGLERYALHSQDSEFKNIADMALQIGIYGGLAGIVINGIKAYAESRLDRVHAIKPRPPRYP